LRALLSQSRHQSAAIIIARSRIERRM
jgi:hypothetical protein